MTTLTKITELLLEIQRASYREGQISACEVLLEINIQNPNSSKDDMAQIATLIRAEAKTQIERPEEEIYVELANVFKEALEDIDE